MEMPQPGSVRRDEIRMDLVIFVPERFARIEVANADGPVSVSDVRELQVVVGYGTLNATRTRGNVDALRLEGSMLLMDIEGDVTVNAIRGYGEANLSGIGGSVVIGDSGIGPTRISYIGGDVTIGSAGYGIRPLAKSPEIWPWTNTPAAVSPSN